jgi:hypothetical protein
MAQSSSIPKTRLAWGAKVTEDFKRKVIAIGREVRTEADSLMSAMAFETGEKFTSDVRNPGTNAVGLIQFLPSTAQDLDTTTEELARMSPVEQLDYVRLYFLPYTGRLGNLGDVYMAILWPAAIGKADSYILFEWPSPAYKLNGGLDYDGDKKVSRAEALAKVQKMHEKGLQAPNVG